MTTGFRPADADIDELRVSRIRRYRGKTFVPARSAASDPDTLLQFHFNDALEAALPGGLRMFPGPAQQQWTHNAMRCRAGARLSQGRRVSRRIAPAPSPALAAAGFGGTLGHGTFKLAPRAAGVCPNLAV
ncbi:MAG: hypothetical protein GXP31_10530 [Kiritimatiellaeota bacterium]|nr:hypothetical protein [Kiritimatiellota bacterium]